MTYIYWKHLTIDKITQLYSLIIYFVHSSSAKQSSFLWQYDNLEIIIKGTTANWLATLNTMDYKFCSAANNVEKRELPNEFNEVQHAQIGGRRQLKRPANSVELYTQENFKKLPRNIQQHFDFPLGPECFQIF